MSETEIKNYTAIEDLEEYQRALGGPDWLARLRGAARERFEHSGWPTTQEEEWRRTNLSPFEFDVYGLYPPGGETLGTEPAATQRSAPGAVPADRAGMLTYGDGSLVRASVQPELADQGVVFGDVMDVASVGGAVADKVRAVLERSVADADNRLVFWHFAMLRSAAVLYVPAGVAVDAPFEVDAVYAGDELADAPHLVVVLERGAQASVVRRIRTDEEGEILLVDGSEFVVEDGAHLRYVNLQRMNEESLYFCHDRGNVGRDGHVHRTEVALGADFVKSRYVSELTGAGADAVLNGIYFPVEEQHADLRTVQMHRAPHTTSRAFYRGAVRDESHAIYQGLIQVDHEAAGTDAYLTNKNLILSDEARADSIPSLNIKTDDVRCSHGSTTGKLDENQLFYLRTRGYTEAEAKRMLVEGYFEDLILQTPELVHEELRELIMERIPQDE